MSESPSKYGIAFFWCVYVLVVLVAVVVRVVVWATPPTVRGCMWVWAWWKRRHSSKTPESVV